MFWSVHGKGDAGPRSLCSPSLLHSILVRVQVQPGGLSPILPPPILFLAVT